jgi:WD40 repeat protein
VAFNHDNSLLAAGLYDHTIALWRIEDGEQVMTFEGHSKWVNNVLFSMDQRTLFSASLDKMIKQWCLSSFACIRTLSLHTDWVLSLSQSFGKFLASGSSDKTVRIWDCLSFECIHVSDPQSGFVFSVQFCPVDSSLLASASGSSIVFHRISSSSLSLLRSIKTPSPLFSLSFSPCGTHLFSAHCDGSIRIHSV